jgi:hypothetical protein
LSKEVGVVAMLVDRKCINPGIAGQQPPIDAWWRSEGLLTIDTKKEEMFANPGNN